MTAHLSERRHRLNGFEVPEVKEALKGRLWHHYRSRDSLQEAAIAFRVLYRLETHTAGKPDYPEPITWELIGDWLKAEEMVPLETEGQNIQMVPLSALEARA